MSVILRPGQQTRNKVEQSNMALTKEQAMWVGDYIHEMLVYWTHPAGDDAHMHMQKEQYDKEAAEYFYQLKKNRTLVYRDWSDDLKELSHDFKQEFDIDVNQDTLLDIFMKKLEVHCIG